MNDADKVARYRGAVAALLEILRRERGYMVAEDQMTVRSVENMVIADMAAEQKADAP